MEFPDAHSVVEKDFSWLSGSIGIDATGDWLGEALKAKWIPDRLLAGLGDQVSLVSNREEIETHIFELFKKCDRELHVCTHESYLLNQIGQIKQVLVGVKNPPYLPKLFLYTPDDTVAKTAFALSDLLKIVDIQKTSCEGHFLVFDQHSVLIFLDDDLTKAQKMLHAESSFAANFLKSLVQQK